MKNSVRILSLLRWRARVVAAPATGVFLLAWHAGAQTTAPATALDNPQAPLSITANKVFADEFDTAPPGSRGKDASGKVTKWASSLWFGSGYARQGGGQAHYADDVTGPGWWPSAVNYNPFSAKDGILSITAVPMEIPGFKNLHYASGILTTMQSFYMDYGYYEVRMKCPGAPGNWTAFFLYPADDCLRHPSSKYTKWEMDFLEILGSGPDKIHVTTHQKADQNAPNSSDESVIPTGPNDNAFHVWGFDRQPTKVDVYRDGKLVVTKKPTSRMTSAGFLCLVLDVGKDGGWAGTPDPKKYPQVLQVDYVRVYTTPLTTVVGGPFSSKQMGDVTAGPP